MTSAVGSSERWTAVLVVVRRVVLLAGFLLTGLVVAAGAAGAERGVDEAPRPLHDRLMAEVAESVPVESDVVDGVRELVDVVDVVDRTAETPVLGGVLDDVLDTVDASPVGGGIADVTDMVRGTSVDLATVVDFVIEGDEVRAGSLPLSGAPSVVVERARPSEDVVAWSPVVPRPLIADTVMPTTASTDLGYAVSGDTDVHRDGGSGQLPSGFPMAPLSVAGTGCGASMVGSSAGSAVGGVVPGTIWHDVVFALSVAVAEGVYPVRQLATVPQVSPA